jgi:hypothetical protein
VAPFLLTQEAIVIILWIEMDDCIEIENHPVTQSYHIKKLRQDGDNN